MVWLFNVHIEYSQGFDNGLVIYSYARLKVTYLVRKMANTLNTGIPQLASYNQKFIRYIYRVHNVCICSVYKLLL